MPTDANGPRNWFAQGGQAYARFRPEYPDELARYLSTVAPTKGLAVDVGCGTGQLTCQLAAHFVKVLGVDPSSEQVTHATPRENVDYACAPAEALPAADHVASLITVAQAAHWFDLTRFYAEVRRIGVENAALSLISYGVLELEPALNERFSHFYWYEIGPYWPQERKLVDTGYADLPFPFNEHTAPKMYIRKAWTLDQLLGYVATWSAVRKAEECQRGDVLTAFAAELAGLWGDPHICRDVRWPINMRLGTL